MSLFRDIPPNAWVAAPRRLRGMHCQRRTKKVNRKLDLKPKQILRNPKLPPEHSVGIALIDILLIDGLCLE